MTLYRGRFAPSPSGPLHFGSLIAALGSWLDAKYHHGEWLLRIEDIDPPREVAGAADDILKTLDSYGLHWDQEVSYQSNHVKRYQQIIDQLMNDDLVYRCNCTRKEIKALGGIYQNTCRDKKIALQSKYALRLKVDISTSAFDDYYQGYCAINENIANEDFILKRKDGLYAYMLAVVVDDIDQKISHVIRGADLLETTQQQRFLFNILKKAPPIYGHLPLAVNELGMKLSKQNHAQAISFNKINENIWQALAFLQQAPPDELRHESKEHLLQWAVENWQSQLFSGETQIESKRT
jgi:glutamyl-Q tRNA(Asp) synthetase